MRRMIALFLSLLLCLGLYIPIEAEPYDETEIFYPFVGEKQTYLKYSLEGMSIQINGAICLDGLLEVNFICSPQYSETPLAVKAVEVSSGESFSVSIDLTSIFNEAREGATYWIRVTTLQSSDCTIAPDGTLEDCTYVGFPNGPSEFQKQEGRFIFMHHESSQDEITIQDTVTIPNNLPNNAVLYPKIDATREEIDAEIISMLADGAFNTIFPGN